MHGKPACMCNTNVLRLQTIKCLSLIDDEAISGERTRCNHKILQSMKTALLRP